VKLAAAQLEHRALGPRWQTLEPPRQLPKARVAQRSRLARETSQLLAHAGVFPRRVSVAADRLGQLDQLLDLAHQVAPAADSGPFEHQRGDGDLPSLVFLADKILLRHLHVLEEDLVEIRVAGYLHERA